MHQIDRLYLELESINVHDDLMIKMIENHFDYLRYWRFPGWSNEMPAQTQGIHAKETSMYDNDNIVVHQMDHTHRIKHR